MAFGTDEPAQQDARLLPEAVRARYGSPDAYERTDPWHEYTAERIRRELAREWARISPHSDAVVLNAGAGNSDLGICPPSTIHLDISEAGLRAFRNGMIGSVESIPLASASVDVGVCVGSVINYCDAALAISELCRVLKPQGHLFLEFESSRSAEFINQRCFGKSAAVAETFYGGITETVWVYSSDHIERLLRVGNVRIAKTTAIHILSPWMLLAGADITTAGLAARLDRAARVVSFAARWASNFFLVCQKS